MSFRSDGPIYTYIQCPNCGKEKTVPTWKLNGMARDAGVVMKEWSLDAFGAKMRCARCGTKGMVLTGR